MGTFQLKTGAKQEENPGKTNTKPYSSMLVIWDFDGGPHLRSLGSRDSAVLPGAYCAYF